MTGWKLLKHIKNSLPSNCFEKSSALISWSHHYLRIKKKNPNFPFHYPAGPSCILIGRCSATQNLLYLTVFHKEWVAPHHPMPDPRCSIWCSYVGGFIVHHLEQKPIAATHPRYLLFSLFEQSVDSSPTRKWPTSGYWPPSPHCNWSLAMPC